MLHLVLLVLISVTYVKPDSYLTEVDPSVIEDAMKVFMSCFEKTGVDSTVMQKVMSWDFEDNDDVKKYMYCFATDAGYADSNGKLVEEKVLKAFENKAPNEELRKVLDECNKLDGSDNLDTIFKIANCFKEKSPVLIKI